MGNNMNQEDLMEDFEQLSDESEYLSRQISQTIQQGELLKERLIRLDARRWAIKRQIEELGCPHKYTYAGLDSNTESWICELCGNIKTQYQENHGC